MLIGVVVTIDLPMLTFDLPMLTIDLPMLTFDPPHAQFCSNKRFFGNSKDNIILIYVDF